MATATTTLSTNFGYTPSASTFTVALPSIDQSNFSPLKIEAKEVVMTNMTSPVDQPETLRLAINDIQNIYSGSGIDPAYYGASKRGFSVLVQLNDTLRLTDSAKPEFAQDFPISCHLVIKGASSAYLSADDVYNVAKRLVSFITPGSDASTRINELVRGALLPTVSTSK